MIADGKKIPNCNRPNGILRKIYPFEKLDEMYYYIRSNIIEWDYSNNSKQCLRNPEININLHEVYSKDQKKWEYANDICKWININIMAKIDINNSNTDRVLLRIATGMINKLPWTKEEKIEAQLNLLENWRYAKQEWYAFKVMKNDLPF